MSSNARLASSSISAELKLVLKKASHFKEMLAFFAVLLWLC